MALVAYSDESDLSDDENFKHSKITDEKRNSINHLCNETLKETSKDINVQQKNNDVTCDGSWGIDSIVDDDDEDKTVKTKSQNSILSVIPAARSSSVIECVNEEQDIVNDVPTAKTWQITKDLKTGESVSRLESLKPKISKKNKLQFILPSLAELDDGEDSDEDRNADSDLAKKKFKPSSSGTGLFAILPEPRNATSLVPQTVQRKMKPKPSLNSNKKQVHKKQLTMHIGDSDDDLATQEENDFFSLSTIEEVPVHPITKDNLIPPLISDNDSNMKPQIPNPISIYSVTPANDVLSDQVDDVPVNAQRPLADTYIPVSTDLYSGSQSHETGTVDEESLLRLTGRRNKGEILNLIDIKADDALMSRHEWMTRSLTEAKPTKSFSNKEGLPSQKQKRKHQITYLAHQAQEREQDLQNAWGQNRFTKMQTQSKYGF